MLLFSKDTTVSFLKSTLFRSGLCCATSQSKEVIDFEHDKVLTILNGLFWRRLDFEEIMTATPILFTPATPSHNS